MAGRVVVNTDLVIDFLRGRGVGAGVVRTLLRERRMRLTSVTGFELRVGVDFVERRDEIMRMFRSRTVPLDLRSALRAGEVASDLRAKGLGIGFADCLQAGVCLRHDLPLATRNHNHKHFSRVEGLELVNLDAFHTA